MLLNQQLDQIISNDSYLNQIKKSNNRKNERKFTNKQEYFCLFVNLRS